MVYYTLNVRSRVACVASVSSRGSSRKLGQEQKKKWMTGEGDGNIYFFCFRSNFRPITRLETLATQARSRGKQLVLFSRESWCFPRRNRGKHQDSRENKTNWFLEGPDIKCFWIWDDYSQLGATRLVGYLLSYPTRPRGIIVNYRILILNQCCISSISGITSS